MRDEDDEMLKVLRRLEHGEPMPIDDADYATEFPLPAPHEPSTCSHCGASYDEAQFMALALPDSGKGVWTYPTHTVQIAVRKCGTPCSDGGSRDG